MALISAVGRRAHEDRIQAPAASRTAVVDTRPRFISISYAIRRIARGEATIQDQRVWCQRQRQGVSTTLCYHPNRVLSVFVGSEVYREKATRWMGAPHRHYCQLGL